MTTPTRAYGGYAAYGAMLLALLLLSRVPLRHAAGRLLGLLPFILLIAAFLPFMGGGRVVWRGGLGPVRLAVTSGGLGLFGAVVFRSSLALLCVFLLASTTRFERLLGACESLGCPRLLVMVLSFMYRYLFVLSDEAMRLGRARRARSCGANRALDLRGAAGAAGVLFVRSYERAERVYLAMCSRGFDGTAVSPRAPSLRAGDAAAAAGFVAAFAAARLLGGGA